MADDLDQAVRRADPDRWLASRFIADPVARADVVTLYACDHELARAGIVASNSLIAQIRLTWWREVLDEVYAGRSVRVHPTAQALAACVTRRALPRVQLQAMIDGRIAVLDAPMMTLDQAIAWADGVEGSTMQLAARILDPAAALDAARLAGRARGLHDLRRAGRVDDQGVSAMIGETLAAANRAARSLSVRAFPAIACATLARVRAPSALSARLRLVVAVARGRV